MAPNKPIAYEFDTWEAFLTQAQQPIVWERDRQSRGVSAHRTRFTGTESFEQAVDFAVNGWPQGREDMSELITLTSTGVVAKGEIHDVAGAYPDVQAAIAGDPCSMVDLGDQQIAARPILRICQDLSYPGSVDAKEAMNHGAALLAVVDSLENEGYSVELSFCLGVAERDKTVLSAKAVFKRAGDMLDLDRATFALVNPSVLRRFMFALIEQNANLSHLGSGHGQPAHIPEEGGVIRVPPPDYSCSELTTAKKRLIDFFRGAGVKIDWAELHGTYKED